MTKDGSVTTWFGLLETGQEEGAQQLWERYFPPLVRLARAKLRGLATQVRDEEDIALSAFHTFCQAATEQRIPSLKNRDDLWRTLVLITAGKAVDQRRREYSKKRGGPTALRRDPRDELIVLEEVIGSDPDPAFAVQVAEEFRTLLGLLPDEALRRIAIYKLQGHTNEEIAEELQCSLRTVTRRLTVIRRIWEGQ